uniref:CSON012244 protein n=1 Tax=Culicoides sonorensis TaxID=179676 RepID=A0A336MEP9_CULSO
MMDIAVELRKGYKYYGKSDHDPNKKIILNHLDMTVEHGSIYGLLGASGCGKTTLLSCIIGCKHLNSGEIYVLGGEPGTLGSGVPGPRIGYMPQEIALVEELTIKETIYYFGRIYDMGAEQIREKYRFLKELLELPDGDRQLGQCSGGQQRRVSFAAALVHTPELLILDEPTVGLDPILREKIWDFLIEETKSTKLAVIITTHYIDETKKASKIGLMRGGVLLAEQSPSEILRTFNTTSLEDAFLSMCLRQGSEEANDHQTDTVNGDIVKDVVVTNNNHHNHIIPNGNGHYQNNVVHDPKKTVLPTEVNSKKNVVYRDSNFTDNNNDKEKRRPSVIEKIKFTSKIRMKALLAKNFIQMIRQPAGLVFLFFYPILQLVCFYSAIGGDPKNLRIGVVNEEIANIGDCHNESLITVFKHDYDCDWHKISCRYLNALNASVAEQIHYKTWDEAYAQARKGNIIGIIRFAPNFTESLADIHENGRKADNGSFDSTDIEIFLDKSDQQVTFFLERNLLVTFKEFAETLMSDCGYPKALGNVPITFMEPVYGSLNEEFTEFMAPGVVMTMIFFLATLVTSTIFINDRLEGIWDRTLVAGIRPLEMLLAHIITQTLVMLIQCMEIIFLAGVVFGTANNGNDFTVIFLLMLLGFAGMCFGLFISIFCDSHTMANFMATGSFYPMIILCGIMWPLEGMPEILRYFAYLLPFTIPSISVRNVLTKGWSFTHPTVLMGYVTTLSWIVGLLLLCLIGLRIKK